MLRIGVRDGERLLAGAQPAFVDFVGVGGSPVMGRWNGDAGAGLYPGCHALMIARAPAESTGSCWE